MGKKLPNLNWKKKQKKPDDEDKYNVKPEIEKI